MRNNTRFKVMFLGLIVLLGIFLSYETFQIRNRTAEEIGLDNFRAFKSSEEFSDYVQREGENYFPTYQLGTPRGVSEDFLEKDVSQGSAGGDTAERYSETNIQVEGVDEPDIVKTDGRNIFYSSSSWRGNTSVIEALPVENISKRSTIKKRGELLLKNDTLILLSSNEITAYNVEDRDKPVRKYSKEFNGSINTARMYNGNIYIVNSQGVSQGAPCPIRPLKSDSSIVIPCTSIYRPPTVLDNQVTYNVMRLDPETGSVSETVSMVGSAYNTVVYMSKDSLYLTYSSEMSRAKVLLDFLLGEGSDLLNEATLNRLEEIKEYDISEVSKTTEIQIALERYRNSLSKDGRLEFESQMNNRITRYSKERMREYQKTGIVKIGLENLEPTAVGEVPGTPLNQFSLDEYEGNLRIATTVTDLYGNAKSENDVYVLDSDLDTVGSVKGMGLDETVYSVRFIDNRGYVVTYKRIDPFHVLDLSDPENPELKGELKLPGYSSYLHPLDENRILGVGEEEGQVKTVVFDVSDPENPEIGDSFRPDDYYSAVSQSHHAFLIDRKHSVFFLPGSQGGYVFDYSDGLSMEKAVSIDNPQRALYINNYMYVLSDTELVVLDEENWNRVKTLKIGEERTYPLYEEPMVR